MFITIVIFSFNINIQKKWRESLFVWIDASMHRRIISHKKPPSVGIVVEVLV